MLYKMHVRSHLDYGDIIYHNQLSECSELLEFIQYKAALIVAGCWNGTNRLKLYSELGWETLANRRHCRRLCLFFKIIKGIAPHYLKFQPRWSRENFTSRYMNSFFPYCFKHWNALPKSLTRSDSYEKFKNQMFYIFRPLPSFRYKGLHIKDLKLLTRMRCGFSDLREHRYRHKFNCQSPVCACGSASESVLYFFS